MNVLWTEFSFALQPSALGGIGVFAMHDIPAGTKIFSEEFSPRKMLIKDIPQAFLKYCIYLNDEECLCPQRFDRMEIGWYLNHGEHANISKLGERGVRAIKDIKAGDEILINYNELNEPPHMKEDYYAPKGP